MKQMPFLILCFALLLILAGCGKAPPTVSAAQGITNAGAPEPTTDGPEAPVVTITPQDGMQFADQSPATTMDELRERFPEYFDLSTFKGLEVYVWQLAPENYLFGVMEGTNRNKTNEELRSLKGATLDEMRAILSTYDIPRENIFVMPIQQPYSSYLYEIDAAYTADLSGWFVIAEVRDKAIADCKEFDAKIVEREDPIGKLFDAILSSPSISSNPEDYIRAHEEAHQQLLADPNATLQYVFAEFLYAQRTGSGQTGLKGHIMLILLSEIAPEETTGISAETSQDSFNAWMSQAEALREQYGDEWMKNNRPAMYLLLQMAE